MTDLKEKTSNNPWLKAALIFLVRVTGVISFSALVSIFIGIRLDRYFGVSPIITIILVLLGFVFSIFFILREIKIYQKTL